MQPQPQPQQGGAAPIAGSVQPGASGGPVSMPSMFASPLQPPPQQSGWQGGQQFDANQQPQASDPPARGRKGAGGRKPKDKA
eukprot:10463153-Karenia_brevis.AAC.1